MTTFSIGTPTICRFGEGSRYEISAALQATPHPKTLIIASASALRRPELSDFTAKIAAVSATTEIWTGIKPNPRIEDIDACLAAFRDAGITHVVGIGGGSALDQAKATAMSLSTGLSVRELLKLKNGLPARSNQLILVPTTSGTGAEMSYGAILTDDTTGEKLGLRGQNLAADRAFVDPELTYSLPEDVTIVTGFDVLTHAIETYLSTAASPYTTVLSRGAIERVFEWLPVVKTASGHIQARKELAYASMTMGINLALSTTCLPHRLQYPVGAATDTAHAAGLAAIYPAWLAHVRPYATQKLAECARWINIAEREVSDEENAQAFCNAVLDLLKTVDLTPNLSDLGVTEEMVARFPSEVSGRLDTDPGYNSRDDLTTIYLRAFEQVAAR